MSVKHRKKPYIILAYEALFRSLKKVHRGNEIIHSDYQKFNAGFRGERNVDYILSIYPQNDFFIFHDLRLKIHSHFFQIDTLILTLNFICILEIKNMKGTLNYDSYQQQLIQKTNDKETGFKDPILQAETQKLNLSYWLQKNDFKIPIETIVVSSNPSTIINNIHKDPTLYNKLIHAESLHFQLDKLKEKYTKSYLNRMSLNKISKLLLNDHVPLQPNLIGKYRISDHHLIKGVPCLNCHHDPIVRIYKKWSCPKCLSNDSLAYKRVILDYFLLQKNEISNKECRDLLQIESPKIAYTSLNSMNLKQTGKNSARKYHAPNVDDFPQNSYFPNKNKSILDY